MQHLIKEYLDNEFNINVTHLTELNTNGLDGSCVKYGVNCEDRHGFETYNEFTISIWEVLVFVNNKLNNK